MASARNSRQDAAGRTVAKFLLDIKAVNFRPEEPYKLTAGWARPVYIDCRKLISYPRIRSAWIRASAASRSTTCSRFGCPVRACPNRAQRRCSCVG